MNELASLHEALNAAGGPGELRFVTARELRARTPETPDWVWEGFIAAGALAMLAGRPKYAGKSTLACALVEAIDADAGAFLGRRIVPGPVIFVSEETGGTLAPKLPDSDRVSCLTRDIAWPKPTWPQLLAAVVTEAERIGARLVVIDALSFWAALGGEQGNDTAVATAVLAQLSAITLLGAAVLLVHHQRKGGGEDGEAVLGATGFFASVDLLIELERVKDGPAGQRQLISIGRWAETPAALVVHRDAVTGSWRVIGEATDRDEARLLSANEKLLGAVPTEPPGMTEPELADALKVDTRKISGPLRELLERKEIRRDGAGKKGDPYRYSQPPQDSPPNSPPGEGSIPFDDSPPPLKGGESNGAAPPMPPTGEDPLGVDADGELDRIRSKFGLSGTEEPAA